MKWIGERISFVDDKNKTTIVIEPDNKFWVNGLMGAWFSMWLVIGGISIWALLTLELSDQEKVIMFVFLTFWSYYAVRVGRSFFWLIWGKEMIKLDEAALIYKRAIRGYGKAVPYYFQNIDKMRMSMPKENSIQAVWESSPWIRGGERIEFDYMGKVVRMGGKLNEKDANQLFRFITRKIEDRLKKSK